MLFLCSIGYVPHRVAYIPYSIHNRIGYPIAVVVRLLSPVAGARFAIAFASSADEPPLAKRSRMPMFLPEFVSVICMW